MWNFKFLILLLLVGAYWVSTQENAEQTEEDKKTECQYLNSVRANLTTCCQYPMFAIFTWQYQACRAKCAGKKYATPHLALCCQAKCQYIDQMGVITLEETNDDESVTKTGINTAALVFAFLISVGNDTKWEPVINNAVQRCYDDLWGASDGSDETYCDVVPMTFFDIINCSYKEHFLKCPPWNPHQLLECDYTYKFVANCM